MKSPVTILGFPDGSVIKNLSANAENTGSVPGSARSPGEGNGNLHSSVLAWKIPWTKEPGGVTKKSATTQQLNNNTLASEST